METGVLGLRGVLVSRLLKSELDRVTIRCLVTVDVTVAMVMVSRLARVMETKILTVSRVCSRAL